MKIKLYKSVALCSLLALAGCHDFEELNTNPYAPIYDPTVENVSALQDAVLSDPSAPL